MSEIPFKDLIAKPITEPISPTGQMQYRQLMLQILNPLSQYTLFLNPVVQDFPQLTEQYLSKIKYPISMKEIKQKLQPRNLKYQKLGEVFRDLVLLVENCREFNGSNENIMLAAAQFQTAIEAQLSELCKKVGAETFSYDFLKQMVFQNDFAPFEQPKQAKMLEAKDFFELQRTFNQLTPEKQGRALNILVNELDDYEGGDCVIEFTEENFRQFWWFSGVVQQLLTEKCEESEGEEEPGEITLSESAVTGDYEPQVAGDV